MEREGWGGWGGGDPSLSLSLSLFLHILTLWRLFFTYLVYSLLICEKVVQNLKHIPKCVHIFQKSKKCLKWVVRRAFLDPFKPSRTVFLFPISWFAPLLRAGLLPIFGLSDISVITGVQSLWESDVFLALIGPSTDNQTEEIHVSELERSVFF